MLELKTYEMNSILNPIYTCDGQDNSHSFIVAWRAGLERYTQ